MELNAQIMIGTMENVNCTVKWRRSGRIKAYLVIAAQNVRILVKNGPRDLDLYQQTESY